MEVKVFLESEEFGCETFEYDSYADALVGFHNVVASARGYSNDDGVTRRVGIIIEPEFAPQVSLSIGPDAVVLNNHRHESHGPDNPDDGSVSPEAKAMCSELESFGVDTRIDRKGSDD